MLLCLKGDIMQKYNYTERFFSFQGEGAYTGVPTAWLRFFLCNLQCRGFMQDNPADPSTYITPESELINLKDITSYDDLPVFKYGCDSAYSVAKRFKHLTYSNTPDVIAKEILDTFRHTSNPDAKFVHPVTGQDIHMAFTGGEPMLQQNGIVEVLQEFKNIGNMPNYITVETNGTRSIIPELNSFVRDSGIHEWFWSVSPKLLSTSGELAKRAIKPSVLKGYYDLSDRGQLKFVVNGKDETWREMEDAIQQYRNEGVEFPVYVMPVGALKEQQEEDRVSEIAVEAMKRGYYFSGRLHCSVFGNRPNT